MEKAFSLYEDIIESVPGGVISVDPEMRVSVFNQSVERISETSRRSALKRPLKEVFNRDGWLVEAVEETLNGGRVFTEFEGRLHRRVSPPLPVSISTVQVLDRNGVPGGAAVFIKDLTAGVKHLESASSGGVNLSPISYFAANLIHEIRNPLGGIRGAAQLLKKKTTEKRLGEYADIIIRETDRLDGLLREMGDFTGPVKLKKRSLNIHRVLDSVIALNLSDLPAGAVNREYDPSLPPVFGDATRLTQVFLNLLKNAKEAATERVSIRVVTRMITGVHLAGPGPAGGHVAAVDIIDDGCGIKEEDLDKIFTPFYTTKQRGSGLGMPITLKIIKDHDGLINIESTPGRGTKVSVYLPIADV